MKSILKALEQVGKADAIPIIEALAHRKQHDSDKTAICAAAQACLLTLRERLVQKEASEILLRASLPQTSVPKVLFRPAYGTEASNILPQTLLCAMPTAVEE